MPCALVTMSYARFVKPILEGLPPDDTFAAVVTGDSVSTAASHIPSPTWPRPGELDVLASECLAIEDSDTGATSAIAAGCTVLVAHPCTSASPGPGRVFTESLAGLSAASGCPGEHVGRERDRVGQSLPDRDPSDHAVMDPTRASRYVPCGRTRPVGVGPWRGTRNMTRG